MSETISIYVMSREYLVPNMTFQNFDAQFPHTVGFSVEARDRAFLAWNVAVNAACDSIENAMNQISFEYSDHCDQCSAGHEVIQELRQRMVVIYKKKMPKPKPKTSKRTKRKRDDAVNSVVKEPKS